MRKHRCVCVCSRSWSLRHCVITRRYDCSSVAGKTLSLSFNNSSAEGRTVSLRFRFRLRVNFIGDFLHFCSQCDSSSSLRQDVWFQDRRVRSSRTCVILMMPSCVSFCTRNVGVAMLRMLPVLLCLVQLSRQITSTTALSLLLMLTPKSLSIETAPTPADLPFTRA